MSKTNARRMSSLASLKSPAVESAIVLALLGVFLVAAFVTRRQELPWGDEVLTVDSAFNLALGYGFHTYAYNTQSGASFYAGNVPAYPVLTAAWMHIFGVSLYVAHILNYLLVAGSTGILWRSLRATQIVRNAWARTGVVAALLLSVPISYAAFNLRYDAWGYTLMVIAFAVYCVPVKLYRYMLLALIGFVCPFSGVHLFPYTVLLGLILLIISAEPLLRLIPLYIGALCGVAALIGLYAHEHVLSCFLAIGRQEGIQPLAKKLMDMHRYIQFDPSSTALTLCCILLLVSHYKYLNSVDGRILLLTIAMLTALPLSLFLMRRFVYSYAWMTFAPAIIAAAEYITRKRPQISGSLGAFLTIIMAVGVAFGTPRVILGKLEQFHARDYRNIVGAIAPYVKGSRLAVASDYPFFAVREVVPVVITPQYLQNFGRNDHFKIDSAILTDSDYKLLLERIGGCWAPQARVDLPPPLLSYARDTVSVTVYRRVGNCYSSLTPKSD
jgi:hypothetical protein